MREIKFRAWDGKRLVYDDYFHVRYGKAFRYTEFDGAKETDWNLMQYTGLQDLNGRDIYEGDILSIAREDIFGGGEYSTKEKVIWAHRGGWYLEGTTFDNLAEGITNIHGKNISSIIGNIYENPKLT